MKIVEHGLVGKHVQCPTCTTIFEFQHSDELRQDNRLGHSLITTFSILCQECKSNIVVIEWKLIPGLSRGQWHTQIRHVNFISRETKAKSLALKGV